jgi:tetratricopeptide (TPR) repeat protein
MKQQQRKALALAAVLALAATAAAAQTGGTASRGGAAARTTQAAHAAADAGYKAYARRDYAAAVGNAQRATQLAPQRRDYWLLLAQSLLANGQADQAEEALNRAAQAAGDEAALTRSHNDLARARSQGAGDAMYRALQAGDVKAAIEAGTRAVAAAPDNAGYRLVLVHALLRDERHGDAERLANETIALLPDSAAPLALRGYARQGLNRPADAAADLDRALQQRGLDAATQRQLRLLAIDLALAQGNGERALELLQGLAANDAEAAGRRELARQRLGGRTTAAPFALRAPGIDCSNVAAAQTCTLEAAALPALPGYANATGAYAAMEQRDYVLALDQARLATAAAPGQRDWHLLHMNAALANNQLAEADRAATAALELGGAPDGAVLAQRASIRRRLGDVAGANADAEAALRSGQLQPTVEAALLTDLGRPAEARQRLAAVPAAQLTPQSQLDLAYLSNRIGDNEAARNAFVQADQAGALPASSLVDAGYASMRTHRDDEAIGYFKRAIDAVNGLELRMEPQMVYDTRRTISEVSRKWGVLASLTLRNGGNVEPGFGAVGGAPSDQRTLQAGVEAYWRPWGFRNGQFVEAFARGFTTLDNDAPGAMTGGDSFVGGIGVRWKPLTSQNLVLSFSRVFGPNVDDDWLAQVGWSLDRGTDLRVDVPSWWTTRISAEVGHYLENGNTYGVGQLMFGRSYVVGASGRTVLFPHGVLAAEYSSNDPSEDFSAGIGAGVSLRQWFREDVYHAPRSYVDLTLQYRARLAGDDRLRGPYVNMLLSY